MELIDREIVTNLGFIDNAGSYYRHFKGKWYQVITLSEHTETGEKFVVYRALYGEKKVYCRPYEMFTGKTEKDKYPDAEQPYRFMNMKELRKLYNGDIPDYAFEGMI